MREFSTALRQVFLQLMPAYIGTIGQRYLRLKSDGTPVGELDILTMNKLKECIAAHFPHDLIVGEEDETDSETMQRILADHERIHWTVDGLDGTGNRGMGTFSFGAMVARRRGDEILYAAVFLPAKQKLHGNGFISAIRGEGVHRWCLAHQKYERLRTARHGELERITVMLEGSSKKLFKPPISDLGLVITTRPGFSTSVATTAVAEGKASAFVNTTDHKPWDAWPAMLVIEEAGGIVTDHQGKPVPPARCGNIIAAANPEDHRTILKALKGGVK